ncbi:MAG: hypothetical protein HOJ65_02220, partial [Verrucomicrobia bacterium]|nr:hypothetical protein [Verrucomicrobiota bacterium]
MKLNTKLYVWLAALGLGTALGQAAEEDAKPEGTHAEIEPIRFGTHPSGKPITIKTIAMNRDGDLLVGISWGEGKMEFAQPRGEDGGGRAGRGGRTRPGGERGSGGFMQALPVVVALDANGDGEISTEEIEKAEEALAKVDKNGDGKLSGDEVRPSRGGSQRERRPGDQAQGTEKPGDEVARILEFGSDEDIADLAREASSRQFMEALREMSSDDRRKVMSALPGEVRSRLGRLR